jgi:cyclopropane fatty-acyl-phospholipid synthase-like methyltransferase
MRDAAFFPAGAVVGTRGMSTPKDVKEGRIQDRVVPLDYQSTHRFFDNRAEREPDPYSVRTTTFQDHEPRLAEGRDRVEQATILPLLRVTPGTGVLEIGCGSGRWAWKVLPTAGRYHGVDFSDKLVQLGRERARREELEQRCTFQTHDAAAVSRSSLVAPPPFEVVILCGILMYLNDGDSARLIRELPHLCSADARIYVSEAIALEGRMTLVDFYSAELRDSYSAVYRNRAAYEEVLSGSLFPASFDLIHAGPLYPPELRNRADTMQYAWVFERTADCGSTPIP